MNALRIFSLRMGLKWAKPILLSLLIKLIKIFLYVDDIIFGSTDQKFCEEFSRIMTKRFEMSMMGELKFFLGFQIKQMKEGTFICQTKYVRDMLKKFDMVDAKPIKTPMALSGHLDLN